MDIGDKMTQKEIIYLIAKWFNLSDILNLEEFGGSNDEISSDTQNQIDEIIYCINLVVDELACDYFPLLITESITSKNKKIYFSDLQKTILKIFSLKNYSISVPYKSFPEYIELDYDAQFNLTYSFIPTHPQNILSDLEVASLGVTARLVAYGVAREYCIFHALYDQADYYNSRFISAVNSALTKRSTIKLPKRRWFR